MPVSVAGTTVLADTCRTTHDNANIQHDKYLTSIFLILHSNLKNPVTPNKLRTFIFCIRTYEKLLRASTKNNGSWVIFIFRVEQIKRAGVVGAK
ncbi:9577_t:CDS:2 [Dentiscutata heterogama]|uniref:9577_t:CDS:1 n=1 Tax=Dentiscutata heterogama TaxID=1316150 RepID=A0ACA9K3N6_9GLOM|nr:9577_t:CDS:2 [Dentiscutata heterogama]